MKRRPTNLNDVCVDANYVSLDEAMTFICQRLEEAAQRGEEFVNLAVVHLRVATPAFVHAQKKRRTSGVRYETSVGASGDSDKVGPLLVETRFRND